MEGRIIIIEGLQGVGKSVFCESYAKCNKNVVVLKEWVDNQILEEYINDMPNKATSFQCKAQQETIKKLYEAIQLVKENKTVLLDRGIYGNLVFCTLQHEKGYISVVDFNFYKIMCEVKINVPIETWLLKCTPEIALERIKKRNRDGESAYTLEYLQDLDKKHNEIIPYDRIININKSYPIENNILKEPFIRELCEV